MTVGGETKLILNKKNFLGKPRGFGFVLFDTADAVEEALGTKAHIINDKELTVKKAVLQKKKQPPPTSFQLQQQQQTNTNNDIQNNRRSFRKNSKNYVGGAVRARKG